MKILRWLLPLLVLAVLFGVLACDDDCETCPQPTDDFEVVVHCLDEEGQPLANVGIGASPALPEWLFPWGPNGDAASAEKSRVDLRYSITETFVVRLAIRDVERQRVAVLYEAFALPGEHTVAWAGRTESYVQSPSGYYEAVLYLQEDGAWAAVDSLALLQVAFDPGQYAFGLTDASGKVSIRDRRLVPAFFDLLPLEATDEDGQELGSFSLTRQTWLFCVTSDGRTEWAVFEAVDGRSQELTVQFGPMVQERFVPDPAGPTRKATTRPKDARAWLDSPRPNPFN